jgi:hypothetical protein
VGAVLAVLALDRGGLCWGVAQALLESAVGGGGGRRW